MDNMPADLEFHPPLDHYLPTDHRDLDDRAVAPPQRLRLGRDEDDVVAVPPHELLGPPANDLSGQTITRASSGEHVKRVRRAKRVIYKTVIKE